MNFIYSIEADGWISLLGSVLSFVGIFITIDYTKKQFKEDKRISIKPYLDITLKCPKNIGIIETITINKLEKLNLYDERNIGIEITNLGQGTCLECKVIEIRLNGKKNNDESIYIGNIKTDENILRDITCITWYGDILEKIKNKYIGKNIEGGYDEFKSRMSRDTLNVIELQFEYKDVFDNKYNKTIAIETFIVFNPLQENDIYQVSDIEFYDVFFEVNEKLTNEKLIKKRSKKS